VPQAASANAPGLGDPRIHELGADEVRKLVDAPKTPRAFELEYLQSVFEGKQYAGRPSFFTDAVPLQERAPCVVYKLPAVGIESNVAFAMGEGRFPTVLSFSSENDKLFDDDLGISEKESPTVDSFNRSLIDLGRLEQVFRHAYRMGQAARSVAIVLGFRAGLPFADLVWSKLCTPKFEDPLDRTKCTSLEIRYRYTEKWRDPFVTGGKWWTRVFEYLRTIDDVADTEYWPAAIWDDRDAGVVAGSSPVKTSIAHGFGLCPVHWYARNRESCVGSDPDGKALTDGVCELIEQLDLALSQRHRAAIYAGDPQTVLIGVSADDVIGNEGRKARPNISAADMGANGRPKGQWAEAMYGGGSSDTALRRGVGEVWRIQDPQGKALLLTLDGDALKCLDDDAKDLASKACDGLGITLVDAALFKGAGDLSGRTLAFIFSKQINRVSQDREDLGRCCILPVLNLFYRMLLSRPTGVYLPGLKKVLPILRRFYMPVEGGQTVWFCPRLKLKWGDYFEPSDLDESTRTTTAIAAYEAKLITVKTAVEHVRAVFQIGSVDQYVDALKKEVQEKAAADAAALHDAMGALGAENAAGAKPKPGQGNAAPAVGSGRNAAAARKAKPTGAARVGETAD
jgi:hypothetical protein